MSAPKLRLGVNIDHVATIRNARGGKHPDPVKAALVAVEAGADGITAHLREDRRHIRDDDITRLKAQLTKPLNFEMAATREMVDIALKARPHAACIVPERRQELTTEGGLDAAAHEKAIERIVKQLHAAGIEVSLFLDPDPRQIEVAHVLHVRAVEIQTARYSEAKTPTDRQRELDALRQAAEFASERGLHVHMGHGLNYQNVQEVAAIRGVAELNIGHSIVSRAMLVGMQQAVRDMKDAIRRGQRAI
jgi:pyridoxine 5-phosphate synthase